MTSISRREFLALAAALGASAVWGRVEPWTSRIRWRERRDLFPEGVASGDPQSSTVILWTRCPGETKPVLLTVEVAEDAEFHRVIATQRTTARPEYDWTVRVLVGGLQPRREYWYRFVEADGNGSRIGRTITAPADDDTRPLRFAFVSCQDPTIGSLHAWRRMIHEDERTAPDDRIAFVLHLGDFIYEVVNYPEDRPQGYLDRKLREVFRYPRGEKVGDLHIPIDLEDYRTVYRAYLHDPDLQDARARFPFVCMWDNHEFSWNGWQSFQNFGRGNIPSQTRKVAANQAWWEFQPARVSAPGTSFERFQAPRVANTPVERFDEHGLGEEPNNLAAIRSLTAYRALQFGPHLDLLITDQHSYRSEEPTGRREARGLGSGEFPNFVPEEAMMILDAGRAWNGGDPPAVIRFGETEIPNFRRDEPPQTTLGAEQKAWFLERLRASRATWKIWGNSQGVLDWRADPQNLPAGLVRPWPGGGYAGFGGGDLSAAYKERAEIYDTVARERIGGFACVSGDRHSFWAGYMSKALPPQTFAPVGIAFITGSITAAGMAEANEHRFPKDHPLRPLFVLDRPDGGRPEATVNMLLRHGVRSCLEYARSRDPVKARALSNPDNAPHLSFVDMGGHGFATVRVNADAIESEFVCIPRPVETVTAPDGGPIRYRLAFRAARWTPGEHPRFDVRVVEGDPGLGM